MGWPFELDICFLLNSQQVICQYFYRFCHYCDFSVSHRRAAEVAEEIVFSLATERLTREKLQPLRGRALAKSNEASPDNNVNLTENISPPQ
jgi:hypothetical protein